MVVFGGWWWWVVDGWWLVMVGGWLLVVDGWWLVIGGWWLVWCGWWVGDDIVPRLVGIIEACALHRLEGMCSRRPPSPLPTTDEVQGDRLRGRFEIRWEVVHHNTVGELHKHRWTDVLLIARSVKKPELFVGLPHPPKKN